MGSLHKLSFGPVVGALCACVLFAACKPRPPEGPIISADRDAVASAKQIAGPNVPAGTVLRLRLIDGLGTRTSQPGDRFEAAVVDPVRRLDGTPAIAAGALVHGTVAGTSGLRGPTLVLSFDTIQVGSRDEPLEARIEDASFLRAPEEGRSESYAGATATFPAGTGDIVEPRYLEPDAIPGRGRWRGDIVVPPGAPLRIVLTEPVRL